MSLRETAARVAEKLRQAANDGRWIDPGPLADELEEALKVEPPQYWRSGQECKPDQWVEHHITTRKMECVAVKRDDAGPYVVLIDCGGLCFGDPNDWNLVEG